MLRCAQHDKLRRESLCEASQQICAVSKHGARIAPEQFAGAGEKQVLRFAQDDKFVGDHKFTWGMSVRA